MASDDLQRSWMNIEPRSPTATTCPKCGCEKHYRYGPSMQSFGLGLVVCFECTMTYSHADKWLKAGLRKSNLTIPDQYQSRVEGIDDPSELYDGDRDSEGVYAPRPGGDDDAE